jgi:hydrogenase-4 membrane subunit HyfE
MSPLLIALLGALLIPLFVGTWRMSLLGLALQGWILAALAYPELQPLRSAHAWLTLADLGLVRGVLVPLALYTVLRAQGAPARNDTLAPNLFSWTLTLGMVLAAYNLSAILVSDPGREQTLVAIAAAGVLLGLLVLASATGPFSQMVGALRIENAIAILELSQTHESSTVLELAMLGLFLATVGLFRWYLANLQASDSAAPQAGPGVRGAPANEPAPDSLTL